jgi:colicin import membrane protein
MSAEVFSTPNERALSGALAVTMHALFLLLLVFGVSWQKRQQEAMVVDLWNNLPPVAVPKAEPAPPKPEPEPPKPEPRVEAKRVPKVEPKPVPKAEPKPAVKPDISLKEKKEKERKAAEQALAEKKKRDQEQTRLAVLKEQQVKERAAREQEDALRKLAQQQAAAQTKLVDEYVAKIRDKIQRRVVKAGCAQLGDPEIQLRVTLLPDGNVLGEPEIRKSSGGSPCDTAVTRAVLLAQPLPLPPDPALFPKFRELNLNMHPNR